MYRNLEPRQGIASAPRPPPFASVHLGLEAERALSDHADILFGLQSLEEERGMRLGPSEVMMAFGFRTRDDAGAVYAPARKVRVWIKRLGDVDNAVEVRMEFLKDGRIVDGEIRAGGAEGRLSISENDPATDKPTSVVVTW